ncbi:hypothetical protein [uncultured Bacteroides sp.]|uniref:hypothetical protein n=1 Tax=uncultured Bacteroides sp. TaxID=162156 RepID=UPI0026708E4A|nr:hypothetical protein [uncultured Bacteroides sp.]
MDKTDKNTLIVCEVCGSSDIQEMGWVDPNTDTFISYADMGMSGRWCDRCEAHTSFCSMSDYMKKKSRH